MLFSKPKPRLTRAEQLASRPALLVVPTSLRKEDGSISLTIPLRQASKISRLFRMPADATKTFELDPVGAMVWESIDGKTSVHRIIRKLSKRYKLSEREAEVSTIMFLKMLTRKGLIGMQVKNPKSSTEHAK
jgi:hypothetical protein